jgi:hypothetical protein
MQKEKSTFFRCGIVDGLSGDFIRDFESRYF